LDYPSFSMLLIRAGKRGYNPDFVMVPGRRALRRSREGPRSPGGPQGGSERPKKKQKRKEGNKERKKFPWEERPYWVPGKALKWAQRPNRIYLHGKSAGQLVTSLLHNGRKTYLN
jgi:hypothetical protein